MTAITSVAATILKTFGLPDGGLSPGAAPADARVAAQIPTGGVKKLLIYAPDAIGRLMVEKLPAEFRAVEAVAAIKVSLQSVFPPKTPVCFASMFSGLSPDGHGIRRYEKPVLSCRTIFDVLPQRGIRTAIVAVKDSSIDLIFRGREVSYYSEPSDQDVTARALALIAGGAHDCVLAYHQNYDDILHASDPWNASALEAAREHARAFLKLAAAADKAWGGLPRALLFAPDHGAHIDPADGKGTHGEDIPDDMDVFHFWDFRPGK